MKKKWLRGILALGMIMIWLEVDSWDSHRENGKNSLSSGISWASRQAMAGETKPASPAPSALRPNNDPSATPEKLDGLLKDARWGEALVLYDEIYNSREKGSLKDLRLICQGLLKEFLKASNFFDRIQAAGALVEQGDLTSFGFLEEGRSDQDPLIRASTYQEMVEVLGGKGNAMALSSLQKGLSDEDEMVRIQLMEALKRRKSKDSSLLPLLERGLKDRSFAVRSEAAEALGEFDHPSVRPLLEKAIQDEHPYVRLSAMSSLARRGGKTYFKELSQAAQDKDLGVSERAAGLIGRSRSSSFSPLLKGLLKGEKDERRKVTLAGSLTELGDRGGLLFLEKNLQNVQPHLRLSTVKALGRSHQKVSLPLLRRALKDEDPSIRTFAVIYLGELEDREALPLLVHQLKDRDPWVRMSSAQVLGEIGGLSLIGPLRDLLRQEEDPGVRVFALRALSRILQRG